MWFVVRGRAPGVDFRACQVGDRAGRLAERQLGHPLGDFGGLDRPSPLATALASWRTESCR
jgi:hypothetical protein